ncbi:GIY-YIG nuclease family protein [Campylobacter sp. RM16188]|uniref:GIY-YIG nuclease family protein n=1 Tax=Campylobacter sp. RM16188 TaxID=1705725 RepID=UPI00155704DA|nr:GIY-YIG nuclease family protein [Campylobacter sp. RM16188]
MADYKNLDDVFSDPFFAEILKSEQKEILAIDEDELDFKAINDFFQQNGKLPQKAKIGSSERRLFLRLEAIKNDEKKLWKLKRLDGFNLLPNLPELQDKQNRDLPQEDKFSTLDEALSGLNEILSNNELEKSLFDTSGLLKPKQRRIQPDDYAQRTKLENFDRYEQFFKQIHSKISSGEMKLEAIGNSQDIKNGDIFVLKGIMLYIEKKTEEFKTHGGVKNAKMFVVYENGTFANLRQNSLAAGFRRSDSYRVVENKDQSKDIQTGFVYVLRSLSTNKQICKLKNLYKIGSTTKKNIRERIANAQNEPTYLYSPVEIVVQYEVINFSPVELEKKLHHIFSNRQLQTEITLPNGNVVKPKEWFIVELDEIENEINKLITKIQEKI